MMHSPNEDHHNENPFLLLSPFAFTLGRFRKLEATCTIHRVLSECVCVRLGLRGRGWVEERCREDDRGSKGIRLSANERQVNSNLNFLLQL